MNQQQPNKSEVPVFCTDYREIQRRQRLERLGEIGDQLADLKMEMSHRIKHGVNYHDIEKKMEHLRNEAAGLTTASQI
ncbi:hypothetical protein [Methylotuvimicrobium sp. KM1]|uniref:hypothetical protein n=1 Tax=unclassified Methylotuvimicrobium TaxID=2822412 RepID=UPI0038506CDB